MRTSAGQVVLAVNWNGTPATATAESALVNTSGAWVVVVLAADDAGPVAGVEVDVEVEAGVFVAVVVVELGRAEERGALAFGGVVLHAAARTARIPMAKTLTTAEPVRPGQVARRRTGAGLTIVSARGARIPSSSEVPMSRRRPGATAYWAGGPAGDELPDKRSPADAGAGGAASCRVKRIERTTAAAMQTTATSAAPAPPLW